MNYLEKQRTEFANSNLLNYFLGKENRPSVNENYPF